jgi:hypothetical protein
MQGASPLIPRSFTPPSWREVPSAEGGRYVSKEFLQGCALRGIT